MENVTETSLPSLPPREAESHKGDYGRVIVLGGSRGMAGAPALVGMAALRSGAGLVTVATPKGVQPTVAQFSPCYMTIPLLEDDAGIATLDNLRGLASVRERFDVWAVGPGLGQSQDAADLIGGLYREVQRPMVVDADGLNALANLLKRDDAVLDAPGGPRVLTPHPGEFARLTQSQDRGVEPAGELARRDSTSQTVVVLKGHRTIVTDGRRYSVNSTGNPGMATGGTGDCLTGVIAALVAQGLEPFDAARLGVHLHGAAGDAAAAELGETSVVATDLIQYLAAAFSQSTAAEV